MGRLKMSIMYSDREDLGSILMRVIRTLRDTDEQTEREDEKQKLEQQYRESDQKLDSLVLQRQKELTQVMQRYAAVSNRLTTSRTKIRSVKESLIACKELLHYKRDELKRLWLDGVEHRHVLELLEQVEELKDCPEKIVSLLSQKKYLEATQALVRSLDRLDGDLKCVEGLAEVKEVLVNQKETLYNRLLEDLSKQLFTESTWEVLKSKQDQTPFQRTSSGNQGSRGSKRGSGTPLSGSGRKKTEFGSRPGSGRKPERDVRVRKLLLRDNNQETQMKMLTLVQEEEFEKIVKNPKLAELSEGPSHVIVIDIECLALLNQLPVAIDAIKSDLLNELQSIVTRSTQILIENGQYPQGDSRLLPELFTTVVDQFNLVVDCFRIMLRCISDSVDRNKCEPVKFDIADVWARIQSVMQMMLTDYLDFKSKNSLSMNPNTSETSTAATSADINSFFVRRKTQRTKRESLFRFDDSSTAMTMKDYLKEQSNDDQRSAKRALICAANPHNITPIYPQLMEFIGVIEAALKPDPGTNCTLYAFLMDYIKDVFLGQIRVDNGDALNSASVSLDSWKAITDSDILRDLGVQRPLLQSSVDIKKSIDDLSKYMKTLPLYSEHFLTMICNMVMQYKEICLAAYRGVVQPESEDKRIISAEWAKDEDIARFLKALPNWQVVQEPSAEIAESPQEVDLRNTKETAMLKRNLGGFSEIPVHNLLYDANQLRSLAQLQESLEWFSKALLTLVTGLKASNANSFGVAHLPKLSENSIKTLTSRALEFEELSDTCLLVLHLEVRVHCFHYLHSIWKGPAGAQFSGGHDSTEPNLQVTTLTKDLLLIEDALSHSLQERKIRYIFEGVSLLVAAIFIGAAMDIRKINENGVKKMCRNIFAVQHTLTSSITGSRETALDTAKQYYELCNQRPQEILNGIVEKGPMYTQEEYANIIKLLNRSDITSSSHKLASQLEKLGDIMKKVGVAV